MGWIETISNEIEAAFSVARPALTTLPTVLLIYETQRRPGLSAIALASSIIKRLPEAGIPTENNADGSENKILKFVTILCEEIITEIKDNARITTVCSPATITSVGEGGNAGGPVTVVSQNTLPFQMLGILQ